MGYEDNLAKLHELKDNWDGYHGKKPTAAALATARWLVAVPAPNGGVQIEMHAGEADIEIEIGPDGRIAAARLYVQDGLSTNQIAERMRCRPPKVASALRRIGLAADGSRITWKW